MRSLYLEMLFVLPSKPVLQYSSAFDDEVVELTEGTAPELPDFLEAILENVQEEPFEAMMDAAPEPQVDVETPAAQAESGRPSANVVHGPYYYFYQGELLFFLFHFLYNVIL